MDIGRREFVKGVSAAVAAAGLVVGGDGGTAVAAAPSTLRPGAKGPAVRDLQVRLNALGYWTGTTDGVYGDLTRQAVVALQKVAGLGRDGVTGPATRARLNAGVRPRARSTGGHVVEVDKRSQVLLVVDAGRVTRILNTSTGSGQRYLQGGSWHTAYTPAGRFTVFRQVDRWDNGPLGRLYRPKYFNGGIAVHGYPSVPSVPASHGCVRVSLPAMDLLWRAGGLANGSPVLVY